MYDGSSLDENQNITSQSKTDHFDSSMQDRDIYVVGIDASTGGIKALEQFLTNMPQLNNMAFVEIQRLSPDFKSLIQEVISKNNEVKVYQIEDGMKIIPGGIFLNPTKYTVAISNGRLFLREHDQAQHSEGSDALSELYRRIADLEEELQLVKETLQSTSEELETSKEELQSIKAELDEVIALDSRKSDFFSNLSHELRTPLNVIMSTLQLLESQRKNHDTKSIIEKQGKHFNVMKQNCYRQLRLVNNMIDSTKIDAGFFELSYQNHNIVSIIENITLSVSDYIRNKGIELIFDTDVEERILACNLDSIERIVLNLLSNAVKFTKDGGSINVYIKDNVEAILISVKDSGIGIPKDKLNIIFDRFRQADKALIRNHEGSGIGLSLVKSLVEMHKGSISVQSECGKGTEFLVELPKRIVSEENSIIKGNSLQQSNVEKIYIEFADIYNF